MSASGTKIWAWLSGCRVGGASGSPVRPSGCRPSAFQQCPTTTAFALGANALKGKSQVSLNIGAKGLDRRDVENAGHGLGWFRAPFVLGFLFALAEQLIDRLHERSERLSGPRWRDDQCVLTRSDGGPGCRLDSRWPTCKGRGKPCPGSGRKPCEGFSRALPCRLHHVAISSFCSPAPPGKLVRPSRSACHRLRGRRREPPNTI
jgi:hypothetical protein